jgi:prolyl 4-hydroxylase
MKLNKLNEGIYTIENFISNEECIRLINQSEKIGFEEATVETEKGAKRITEVRNNQRVLLTDYELANSLWEIVKEYAPLKIGNSVAVGLNELFRFYKYEPNNQFRKHIDQSFIRNEDEASYYTFMIYLNDDYEGGETAFSNVVIKGQQGMALIFLHSLEHEGSVVKRGIKYVLRSDIMYKLVDE